MRLDVGLLHALRWEPKTLGAFSLSPVGALPAWCYFLQRRSVHSACLQGGPVETLGQASTPGPATSTQRAHPHPFIKRLFTRGTPADLLPEG